MCEWEIVCADHIVIAILFPSGFSEFVVEQLMAHVTSMVHFIHGNPGTVYRPNTVVFLGGER